MTRLNSHQIENKKIVISKIRKRDGRIVDFDQKKITEAIWKAARSVGGTNRKLSEEISDKVVENLKKQLRPNEIPSVEQVQDIVEKTLIETGHARTAKSYILYRNKRTEIRQAKAMLGVTDDLKLSLNAIKVLASRYLRRDEKRRIIESTGQLFRRVAHTIASADKLYKKNDKEVAKLEEEFYQMMTNLEFLPNSPTLMNAGTDLGQLSACFVLPVDDDVRSIFEAVKNTALIHQCLVPETLVMTNNGLIKLCDVKAELEISTESGIYSVGNVYNNGVKDVFKVKTKRGYEITGTFEHRLLTVDDDGEVKWKQIGELKVGDWVVLSNSGWFGKKVELPDFIFIPKLGGSRTSFKPIFYQLPTKLTPELAELIGIYIGDGSNHRDGIRFTVSEKQKDLVGRIGLLSNYLFSKKPTITYYKNRKIFEVAVLSIQIKQWFKFLGIIKSSARSAEIPNIILQAPENIVCSFLRGLFSTDGCIRKSGHITLTSASESLVKTTQIIMLHLGIPTRLYFNKKTKVYQLSVCSKEGFINFKKKIGFSSIKKQKRLEKINSEMIFKRGEIIPNQIAKLKTWYDSIPWGEKLEIRKFFDSLVNRNERREISRQKIEIAINKLIRYPEFFNDLISKDWFYTQVTEIMHVGEREVFDLTIPIKHSYIANGFVTHNSGGGTGFSFSRIRPKGDIVKSTGGIASGPLSFMKVFDAATDVIKQGGRRRGANMGMMRIDHPDILEFMTSKEREGTLANFNISVAVTDEFMKAVENNSEFNLINPRNGEVVKTLPARALFNLMIMMTWKNGEPGIIFIDEINRYNTTPQIGQIESTNPCAEQPLLSYESCNLGSINLAKMIKKTNGKYEIDWEKLRRTVRLATKFLDNVIDVNKYPIPEIERMTKVNRKIGLGVMGFADMLIRLGKSYHSEEGVETAEQVMKFINDESKKISEELGKERVSFPNFKGSIWEKKGYRTMRNATTTTIAPTGTIGVIASASSGIEPLFAISYIRSVGESLGHELIEVNPMFEQIALERNIYNEELMRKIAMRGSVQKIEEVPEDLRKVFVTALDITPEWHVRMQAAFQKYTDNAVSKTINFPYGATPHDVEKAFMLAWKLKCKGITIYRYGSREKQVLNIMSSNNNNEGSKPNSSDEYTKCPTCSL